MFNSEAHAVERNFTQAMIDSLSVQYPDKNRLVFHNQKSAFSDICTFCLFCYRPFLADFLQRPTPFIHTTKLKLEWALLRAMRSMSLTLALSGLLATVGMRTGHMQVATPG